MNAILLLSFILWANEVLSQDGYGNRAFGSLESPYGHQSQQRYDFHSNQLDDQMMAEEDWEPTSTVLSTYELYRKNWCRGLMRSSAPDVMPDTSDVMEFEEKFVVPEYRSLWHRSCYLPHHSAAVATHLYHRGAGIAGSTIRQTVGTANTAINSGRNVIQHLMTSFGQ